MGISESFIGREIKVGFNLEETPLCVMESYDSRLNEYQYIYTVKLEIDGNHTRWDDDDIFFHNDDFSSYVNIFSKINLHNLDEEDLLDELADILYDHEADYIYHNDMNFSDLEIVNIEIFKIVKESRKQLFLFPEALLMIKNLDELDDFWLYEKSEFVFM